MRAFRRVRHTCARALIALGKTAAAREGGASAHTSSEHDSVFFWLGSRHLIWWRSGGSVGDPHMVFRKYDSAGSGQDLQDQLPSQHWRGSKRDIANMLA